MIIRNPIVRLKFGSTTVDLTPYVFRAEPSSTPEMIDAGTFASPNATDTGKITNELTLSIAWDPALPGILKPHLNTEGTLELYPEDGEDGITATVKYATLPWGSFEPGTRSETEWALAVLTGFDTLTWVTP